MDVITPVRPRLDHVREMNENTLHCERQLQAAIETFDHPLVSRQTARDDDITTQIDQITNIERGHRFLRGRACDRHHRHQNSRSTRPSLWSRAFARRLIQQLKQTATGV